MSCYSFYFIDLFFFDSSAHAKFPRTGQSSATVSDTGRFTRVQGSGTLMRAGWPLRAQCEFCPPRRPTVLPPPDSGFFFWF